MNAESTPTYWDTIARQVKALARWSCEVCGHPDEQPPARAPCLSRCTHASNVADSEGQPVARILSVHYLDRKPNHREGWNLVATCAPCWKAVRRLYKPALLHYQMPLLPWPKWLAWRIEDLRTQAASEASSGRSSCSKVRRDPPPAE